ncbi:GntR family transcriptional regulator [uncultured Erythrobacter sp.]|nr:GntR family transcriptional regulator [uncultured Erythrobacter sp.]
MQITSDNISDQAADAIREMIVDGTLTDGDRINEVRLAATLGVSRTPLREGLARLVAQGAVTTEPRRGFFVAPLTLTEFEQVYGIRPILDPEALRLAGIPSQESLARLEKLNRNLLSTKTPAAAIDIDNAWHMELLAGCPNKVLIGLIQQMIDRTRRYEHALFRETENLWVAGNEHDLIMTALRDNDLATACAMLKQNMESGIEPIVDWLAQRAA